MPVEEAAPRGRNVAVRRKGAASLDPGVIARGRGGEILVVELALEAAERLVAVAHFVSVRRHDAVMVVGLGRPARGHS